MPCTVFLGWYLWKKNQEIQHGLSSLRKANSVYAVSKLHNKVLKLIVIHFTISEFPFVSLSRQVYMQSLMAMNISFIHIEIMYNLLLYHNKNFALRLALKETEGKSKMMFSLLGFFIRMQSSTTAGFTRSQLSNMGCN